ncbi:alkylation response protein AidB-like acyl-CoA dehydrogenase [Streptosporangium lutulentum]|uniref:Alkylation response protein AidB-like acyl-CoA dehydrogenase n=2 Tax=Streptosporangium lutulentum TaxID=1461250 RepID=A0ABT9QTD7_9ACTN|nr:alkylation response protein AidB-like acyl-CoA dehydrogenase [Streptosporangium lutulentum]
MTTMEPMTGEWWTDWEEEDPLFRQLRLTVRQTLRDSGGSPKQAWDALTDVGAWDFGVPLDRGGLELGHAVVSMLCEEVGCSTQPLPLLGTLVTLDLLSASSTHPGLLDQVRTGELPVPIPGRLPGLAGCLSTGLEWRADPAGGRGLLSGTAGPFSVGVQPGALLLLTETGQGPEASLVTLPATGVELRELADRGGGPTASAVLTDVRVSEESVLLRGHEAEQALARVGLRVAVYQAALLTGLAAATLTAVVERIRSRQQFGQSLVKHQAPRLRVAGLLARLDAIRWAVADAAKSLDKGALGSSDAAGLLALTAETALDVTREAVHLHGASGLARDSVVASCYRRVAWEALRGGRPTLLWETAAGTY